MRAEARAVVAHEQGLEADEVAEYVESETLESMVAVTAVRHSFLHLYLDWQPYLQLGKGEEARVPTLATVDGPEDEEDLRAWLSDLKRVVDDRNEIVHQPQVSEPAVPHPLGTNTSRLDARFTAQRATEAVDLMLDFYRKVIDLPSGALLPWAADRRHVPGDLDAVRSKLREA